MAKCSHCGSTKKPINNLSCYICADCSTVLTHEEVFSRVTCKKCGTVHFAVSREYAEAEVARFNTYFESLTPERQQELYGGKPSSIEQYEQCWCGSREFRERTKGDCPEGCTLGPVIVED